jgi:hypothetical protein
VDRAAEARGGRHFERLGVVGGRVVLLVTGHREADDVRMRALRGVAGVAHGRLHAEVSDGRDEDAALDLRVAPGVVDAADDAVDVVLVGEADEPGVVRAGRELDVDRALVRA